MADKLRATIIRVKRTIEDVDGGDDDSNSENEAPVDSLILEIPKKKPRYFKNLSLEDKEEGDEEDDKKGSSGSTAGTGAGQKGEALLERRVFRFAGSTSEEDVEHPLSLDDFKKVRSELRKAMRARAAADAAKGIQEEEKKKKRTRQPADARVSFVSAKKSVKVLDLTDGRESGPTAAVAGSDQVVTCNGTPMRVTRRKKTVYDIYYCYERAKPRKEGKKTKGEDEDDEEYEEVNDGMEDDEEEEDPFEKALNEEAITFRINDYDSDIFFSNFDDFADEKEEIKGEDDYDSNAEDNSSNTYPDEDEYGNSSDDSDGDPFAYSDSDSDDDDDDNSDDDYSSYISTKKGWNRRDRNSEIKEQFNKDFAKIFGGLTKNTDRNNNNRYDGNDDDDDDNNYDQMDYDDDDNDEEYSRYAYDDEDDDDDYF